LTLKYLYIVIKKIIIMNRQITKVNISVSIDRKLDNLMNEKISNKSKYIEWLIYQDLRNSGDERITKIIL